MPQSSGEEEDHSSEIEAMPHSTSERAEVTAQAGIGTEKPKVPKKRGRPPKSRSTSPARKVNKKDILLPQLSKTARAILAKKYPGPSAAYMKLKVKKRPGTGRR